MHFVMKCYTMNSSQKSNLFCLCSVMHLAWKKGVYRGRAAFEISFQHKTLLFLNMFHSGFVIWFAKFPNVPTGMFFSNCPQKFCTSTGHLWKVARAQKFAPPSSEACVSARVGLALVADQKSACQFAYTLSSCNP